MLFRSFWYIPPQFFSLIPIIYGIRLKFRSTAQLPVLVNAIFWPKFAYFGCRGPISELRCHFFSRILIIKIRLKFWRSGHLNLSNMTKIDTKLLKSVKNRFLRLVGVEFSAHRSIWSSNTTNREPFIIFLVS